MLPGLVSAFETIRAGKVSPTQASSGRVVYMVGDFSFLMSSESKFLKNVSRRAEFYSWRSATIGSVRIARSAGMQQANRATPQSRNATVKNVSASALVTPSSMLFK